MNRCSSQLAICSVLALLLLGCEQKQVPKTSSTSLASIRTVADIERLLPVGMGTNEIISKLGPPAITDSDERGDTWRYWVSRFPAEGPMAGTDVIGIAISMTNGHLMRWNCIYRGKNSTRPVISTAAGKDAVKMQFFLVHSSPFEGAHLVDTSEFPNLGYVSNAPDVVMDGVQTSFEVRRTDTSQSAKKVWALIIKTGPKYAGTLENLTTSNIGSHMLVTLNGKMIAAPTIMGPIQGGRLEITFDEPSQIEALKEVLAYDRSEASP